MTYLWLAVGGALGTLGRYALAGWIDGRLGRGPLGIFVVNVTGAFAIGFVGVLAEERALVSPEARRVVAVGLLGGYTTFSTLAYDTARLLEAGDPRGALANGAGTLLAGLVAVSAGIGLARAL